MGRFRMHRPSQSGGSTGTTFSCTSSNFPLLLRITMIYVSSSVATLLAAATPVVVIAAITCIYLAFFAPPVSPRVSPREKAVP